MPPRLGSGATHAARFAVVLAVYWGDFWGPPCYLYPGTCRMPGLVPAGSQLLAFGARNRQKNRQGPRAANPRVAGNAIRIARTRVEKHFCAQILHTRRTARQAKWFWHPTRIFASVNRAHNPPTMFLPTDRSSHFHCETGFWIWSGCTGLHDVHLLARVVADPCASECFTEVIAFRQVRAGGRVLNSIQVTIFG